ncbi:MAG TPA: LD-carboxypeptidase [Candidatus Binataceae bacterium]|nr:LD-carboxypeptidase [Candidatus Binataceae bacterium]
MIPKARIKPPALAPGDTVGVVAPAAAVDREFLKRGVEELVRQGYRVKVSERALARDRILAGTDAERAAELTRFFADPEVGAIFAARGGYGAGRLLPLLDFDRLGSTPKIFVGFSDQTFLLNALVELSGMICFHGPMVAKDLAGGLTERSMLHLRRLLAGELEGFELRGREAIWPGAAQGELIGGCLSIVVAMLGTPYAPSFEGKILFLEDTGEKAYRIDRMLVQLKQSGALAKVAGVVFGGMRSPAEAEPEQRLIREFAADQTADLGIPVLWGVDVGHGTENFTVAMGARARIDCRTCSLSLIERAVS